MTRIGLRQVWAYKRRMIGTLLAVALGVAFLSGTLLLGDTLRANFDRLFTQANSSSEVLLRSATKVGTSGGQGVRAGLGASLIKRVATVAGVARAEPYIEGYGQLLGRDGKGIGGNGPPTRAANWVPVPSLNPYRLAAGREPRAGNEVVVNQGAAQTGHLRLGDTTTLLTPRPVRVVIVGIVTFGTASGFGPSTFTGMTLQAAQRHLTGNPGQLTSILITPSPGTSPGQLLSRLRPFLPAGVQAVTGTQLAQENLNAISTGFLGFVRSGLTAFAIIALLVAAFSIHNTFSILAAQRSRDSALLRVLGATRRQVIASSLAETLIIGLVGSLAGLGGGIGIAGGLKGVFDGFGFALPAGGLVFGARSALISVAAGLAATVIAGALPVLRAASVPPLAALRAAAAEAAAVSRLRSIAGSMLITGGVIATASAAAEGKASLTGAAAVATVIGVVVFGPVTARSAVQVLGSPMTALRGSSGNLARQNALRNPRRTAASACALVVGVAVVALFTVIGASLKSSARHGISQSLRADLVVNTGSYGGSPGGGGFSPQLTMTVARLPDVRLATGLGRGDALIDGASQQVTIADPAAITKVISLGITTGALNAASPGAFAASAAAAQSHRWRLGRTIAVTYPDGTSGRLYLGAIYTNADIAGDYLISPAAWAPHTTQVIDSEILVKLRPASDIVAARSAVTALAAPFGKPRIQDRAQFLASATQGVNTVLGLVYVMLVLAILIALMGVANTLSLAIHERTRELGLLRAVGQTRPQARSMIRWESVIIALLGTASGVILGTFLGWAVVEASATTTLAVFSAPVTQLIIFLAAGAAAGVVAGLRPARRAARLQVPQALAME